MFDIALDAASLLALVSVPFWGALIFFALWRRERNQLKRNRALAEQFAIISETNDQLKAHLVVAQARLAKTKKSDVRAAVKERREKANVSESVQRAAGKDDHNLKPSRIGTRSRT